MKNIIFKVVSTVLLFNATVVSGKEAMSVSVVDRPNTAQTNLWYVGNRAPLKPLNFIKLPVGNVMPEGWLKECLTRERDGLCGHLMEISAWLSKDNNAWLTKNGDHGWEEVPYWLKGYGDLAYILNDPSMVKEAKIWLDGAFRSQQPDGYFGPVNIRNGKRELWVQMIMLWCLQSYYDYSHDPRVITLMTNYFKWQMTVPDSDLLKDYWENSRGGDNILSIYWLYNRTGDSFLLDLVKKIHRNTADWSAQTLPNWHNVNIAQGFREPATYYMLTGDSSMLRASYRVQELVRRCFGQVPGGMFGADENARMGFIDPRQGTETCGFVEQMSSDEQMLCMTGDSYWADNCEDVAFNSLPAAITADFKALRYLTCPNQVVSDSKNHHPGIDNTGPFFAMNPFSSRCCQHNHGQGWPYLSENLILATPDNGIAAIMYAACNASVKVGNKGQKITINETTNYPFSENIGFTINTTKSVSFPLYVRIPTWATGAKVLINGVATDITPVTGKYMCINREWKSGDKVELQLPMKLSLRTWQVNKNSVSVDYGPLTLSLKIKENYVKKDSKETAIGDSKWQKDADATKWSTYEIYPASAWNYALVINKDKTLPNLNVIHKQWPKSNFPFTVEDCPLEVQATGRIVPSWSIDQYGLCGQLPDEDAPKGGIDPITLIPMGAARIRVSSFPTALP